VYKNKKRLYLPDKGSLLIEDFSNNKV